MMRSITLLIFTVLLTVHANGQSWEDSLLLGKKYYQEKEYDRAYRTLLEAQKLAPIDVDLSQDIGNAAYRSQDYEMAEKAYRAAASNGIDKNKNAKNWHNVGNSQMKAKDYQAAIESYKQSLRMNPKNNKTRYNLAEAQRRLKVQEKQQQKKQQKNQDQQNDAQQGDNQKEGESQENQDGEDDQPQKDSQQGGNSNQEKDRPVESKLTDRKTDRMLEELLRQEMETKKKVQGNESGINKNQLKSGKRW